MPKGPRLHPQTPPDPATGKGCVLPNSPSRPQHPPGFCSDELSSSGSFAPERIHSPTRRSPVPRCHGPQRQQLQQISAPGPGGPRAPLG